MITNHPKNDREKGQSLVEMSLTFGFLVLLLMGLLDIGRTYYIFIALEDSVGEAALYLSLNPDCLSESSGSACADPNNAVYRAAWATSDPNNTSLSYFDWNVASGTVTEIYSTNTTQKISTWKNADSSVEIIATRPNPWGAGDFVTVEIKYKFPLLTPVIPDLVGAQYLTLPASATQIIVSE